MEKKGDAELAKITAEIDALKEEAAQVRLSLKRDALKSRPSNQAPRARHATEPGRRVTH